MKTVALAIATIAAFGAVVAPSISSTAEGIGVEVQDRDDCTVITFPNGVAWICPKPRPT